MRPRISIGHCVCPSVRPSVRLSVRLSGRSIKIALIGSNCTLVHDVIGFIDQSEAWKTIDTMKELQVKREATNLRDSADRDKCGEWRGIPGCLGAVGGSLGVMGVGDGPPVPRLGRWR